MLMIVFLICNRVLCFGVLVFIQDQDGHVLATWQHWSIPAVSRKRHVQALDLSRVTSSAFVLFITPYFCACIFLHLPGVASSVCTFLTFLLLHIFTRVLLLFSLLQNKLIRVLQNSLDHDYDHDRYHHHHDYPAPPAPDEHLTK